MLMEVKVELGVALLLEVEPREEWQVLRLLQVLVLLVLLARMVLYSTT
jgi:hypothetical protein